MKTTQDPRMSLNCDSKPKRLVLRISPSCDGLKGLYAQAVEGPTRGRQAEGCGTAGVVARRRRSQPGQSFTARGSRFAYGWELCGILQARSMGQMPWGLIASWIWAVTKRHGSGCTNCVERWFGLDVTSFLVSCR